MWRWLVGSAFATTLAACVTPPAVSKPALLPRAPLDAEVDANTHGFSWPVNAWWKSFGDSQLNGLIAQALVSAPSLQTAQARIGAEKSAAALYLANSGLRLSANAGISRQRLSDSGLISSRLIGFTWYSQADASLRLDFDLDWWGRQQAGIAASINRLRAAEAEHKAAELILVSALTSTYLHWQNDGARLVQVQQLVTGVETLRRLQAARVGQGIDAGESLDRIDIELAQARELCTVIQGSIEVQRLEMAALAGIAPDHLGLSKPGRAVVAHVEQPPDASLGVIARRPDIVASRWRVEAAVQDVAEARAGFYPDFKLSALAGLSTTDLGKFFNPGSRVASIGGALYLPIFDAGGVRARHGVQRSELEVSVAVYNELVVAAAHDIGTQVLAWRGLTAERDRLQQGLDAARSLQRSTQQRADRGIEDARTALEAQAEVLRLQDEVMQIQGNLVQARIALIKSLGGGIDVSNFPGTSVASVATPRT